MISEEHSPFNRLTEAYVLSLEKKIAFLEEKA